MDDATKSGSLERRTRGRPFAQGNSGRKPGSKNKTTLIGQALLKEAEDKLLRKAIEIAESGDVQMLKFLLDRILPKERSVHVDLPQVDCASDAVDALGLVIDAVANSRMSPSEGVALANLVTNYARTINVADVELRLDNLENKLNGCLSTFEGTLKSK